MESINYAADPATQPQPLIPEANENPNQALIPPHIQSSLTEKLQKILYKAMYVMALPPIDTEEQRRNLVEQEFVGPIMIILFFSLICLFLSYHWFAVFSYCLLVIILGSLIVSQNAIQMGVNQPLLTLVSLIGYCQLPINTAQFIIFCIPCIQYVVKIAIVLLGVARAAQAACTLFGFISPPKKAGLIVYPIGLYYFYVGYLALACESF